MFIVHLNNKIKFIIVKNYYSIFKTENVNFACEKEKRKNFRLQNLNINYLQNLTIHYFK